MTFDLVQERMIEALILWRRAPDREKGWQRIRSWWPEIRRHNHFGDYADTEGAPRPLPLSRAEIAAMEEAAEWMLIVDERDRQLVTLAIAQLAGGAKRVRWSRIREQMDAEVGTRGLGQRYARALAKIARTLNAAEFRAERLSSRTEDAA